ncbi:hypothetical protein PSPO01_07100 [Paraphaeosphaeria sporulosa]
MIGDAFGAEAWTKEVQWVAPASLRTSSVTEGVRRRIFAAGRRAAAAVAGSDDDCRPSKLKPFSEPLRGKFTMRRFGRRPKRLNPFPRWDDLSAQGVVRRAKGYATPIKAEMRGWVCWWVAVKAAMLHSIRTYHPPGKRAITHEYLHSQLDVGNLERSHIRQYVVMRITLTGARSAAMTRT